MFKQVWSAADDIFDFDGLILYEKHVAQVFHGYLFGCMMVCPEQHLAMHFDGKNLNTLSKWREQCV